MNLDELRAGIDRCDGELVRILNERIKLALEIGAIKKQAGGDIYVPAREKDVLAKVSALNAGPLREDSLSAIYREIMSAALALEHPLKIAYLGPQSTFTHQAARSKFGASVEYCDCETIQDVFEAVEGGSADYGVVPIENSTEGAVTHTLDRFMNSSARICAEIYLGISLNLLARCRREDIVRVYSKQEVFGQCRFWLHRWLPGVEQIAVSSTAKAAEMAAAEEGSAALASSLAAEIYGLELIAANVQDMGTNMTRFLVIGKEFGHATGRDKTSLLFTVRHQAGALYGALQAFSANGINMSKIESRPSKGRAWEYMFFVDIEGHIADAPIAAAVKELDEHCSTLTVLGSYPNESAAGVDR